MTLPSTFQPLIRKLDGLLVDGLGSGTRIVPADFFSTDNFYPGKDLPLLSKDAIQGPQACAYVESFETQDDGLMDLVGNISQYKITVKIKIAYHLSPKGSTDAATERRRIEASMLSDMQKVRVILSNASSNLDTDQLGNQIGLSSGILFFDKIEGLALDYEVNSLGIIEASFWGVIELSNDF